MSLIRLSGASMLTGIGRESREQLSSDAIGFEGQRQARDCPFSRRSDPGDGRCCGTLGEARHGSLN